MLVKNKKKGIRTGNKENEGASEKKNPLIVDTLKMKVRVKVKLPHCREGLTQFVVA